MIAGRLLLPHEYSNPNIILYQKRLSTATILGQNTASIPKGFFLAIKLDKNQEFASYEYATHREFWTLHDFCFKNGICYEPATLHFPQDLKQNDHDAKRFNSSKDACIVYLYRTLDESRFKRSYNYFDLKLNDTLIGHAVEGGFLRLAILPGKNYLLSAHNKYFIKKAKNSLSIQCEPNAIKYIKLQQVTGFIFGMWSKPFNMDFVEEHIARKEIPALKLILNRYNEFYTSSHVRLD